MAPVWKHAYTMTPGTEVVISATEFPQFRRLIDFVEDVDRLATERCDLELRELVESAREDLLGASA